MQKSFLSLCSLLCLLFSGSCSRQDVPEAAFLQHAAAILWDDPQTALCLLDTLSPATVDALTPTDRAHFLMLHTHALLKNGASPDPADAETAAARFLQIGSDRYAGEARYVQGAAWEKRGDSYLAAECFKEAEHLLDNADAPPVLSGMVYYKLGMTFETDQLYEAAAEQYRKALPLLRQAGYPLYTACCLRDLARTAPDSPERDSLFAQALREAQLLSDTLVYLDVLSYRSNYTGHKDTLALLGINRYMCNVLGNPRYAADLAEYCLDKGLTDSAIHYIRIFATDTAATAWSRERYDWLYSRWLLATGRTAEAYSLLAELYIHQYLRLAADGKARTYAIARRYDLLREQEKNLRLQLAQQRLWLVIGALLLLLLAATLGWRWMRQRHREQERTQQERIRALNAELRLRRESMRHALEQRVQLTRKMQLASLMQEKPLKDLPAWAQQYINANLFASPDQWAGFQVEFNAVSNDFLTRLAADYPALTRADLQITALIVLGLSIQDICILLNLTKRTVWSRRLRIKTHLGLTESDHLDSWLLQRFNATL
ncbi:MAG: hypothetical protein IJV55_08350 [Paludibacteraceae bacterium]|nr:hypothetical protein [Paludibacteraceae bacterium]